MTDRFAVLLRFNEIRDATTLGLFWAALGILFGLLIVASLPYPEPVKQKARTVYAGVSLAIWFLWLIMLIYIGHMR